MTVPLRIAWVNLADAGAVTASSSVPSLPIDRLQTEDIQHIWRAGAVSAWVLVDLMAIRPVGLVALINSNAIPGDAVRVGVSISDATGAARDAYDSGTIAAATFQRKVAHAVEAGVSGRYVRIDLSQASAPEAGRLVVADPWAPSHNVQYGETRLPRDFSRRSYSAGMNIFFDRRRRQRGWRFALTGLTEEEAHLIEDLNLAAGTSQDVLVCRDVTAADLARATYWGPLEVSSPSRQTSLRTFSTEFELWDRL